MIIIILLILIIFILYDDYEHFSYFNPVTSTTPKSFLNIDNYLRINFPSTDNTSSIYQNRIALIPATFNDISGSSMSSNSSSRPSSSSSPSSSSRPSSNISSSNSNISSINSLGSSSNKVYDNKKYINIASSDIANSSNINNNMAYNNSIYTKLENDPNNFTTNYVQLKSNKCCLVKKVLNGESFNYEYTPYQDNECDLNNFELDHNNQLLFDGESGWTHDKCSNDKTDLGSCQHYDFECIDFVSKNKCDDYNKRMPPDPQHRKITYNWYNKACYSKY